MDGSSMMASPTTAASPTAATDPDELSPEACAMVRGWLQVHRGDVEGLARRMHRALGLGTTAECRRLVELAVAQGRTS